MSFHRINSDLRRLLEKDDRRVRRERRIEDRRAHRFEVALRRSVKAALIGGAQ